MCVLVSVCHVHVSMCLCLQTEPRNEVEAAALQELRDQYVAAVDKMRGELSNQLALNFQLFTVNPFIFATSNVPEWLPVDQFMTF